jgi:uncharacterized membrane protein
MRRFLGIIAFIMGIVFLGESLNLWRWQDIAFLFRFWPLVLIFVGLFLLISDWLWSLVIILILIIALAILSTFRKDLFRNFSYKEQSKSWMPKIENRERPQGFYFYFPR